MESTRIHESNSRCAMCEKKGSGTSLGGTWASRWVTALTGEMKRKKQTKSNYWCRDNLHRDLKVEHKITSSYKTYGQKDLTPAKQRPFKGDFCSGVWDMPKTPSSLSKHAKKERLHLVRKKTKVLASHSKLNFKICFSQLWPRGESDRKCYHLLLSLRNQ